MIGAILAKEHQRRMHEKEKLGILIEEIGLDYQDDTFWEQVEVLVMDSLVPGICMENDCYYIADYEPDQDAGWCAHCSKNSVKSLALLMGIM